MPRKTYKIKFQRIEDHKGMIVTPNAVHRRLLAFCTKRNINIKKIKIKDLYKNSYIKIEGTREEFITLYYHFFCDPDVARFLEIVTNFKV